MASPIPVLFVTELVGLALGIGADRLGLRRHFVDPRPLAARVTAGAAGAARAKELG